MGVDVVLVGPMPTPAIAFLTKDLEADAGIIISASHNSFEDNGIKFFSKNGVKLPDNLEMKMEHLVLSGELDAIRPIENEVGKAFRIGDAEERYINYARKSIPDDLDFNLIPGLSTEVRYRLGQARPANLGSAARIAGVTPAAITVLLAFIKKREIGERRLSA